jgi:hypothetical protein
MKMLKAIFLMMLAGLMMTLPVWAQSDEPKRDAVALIAPNCVMPDDDPFLYPNLLKNPSYNTVGPNGIHTQWLGPLPVPPPPAAAAQWDMHNSNAGDYIGTTMLPSSGPQGPRMLRILTRGNEGGVTQRFLPDGEGVDHFMIAAWVFVKRGNVMIGTNDENGVSSAAFSTKVGEWELLRACRNGDSKSNFFFAVNQDPKGGEFYIDAATVVALPLTQKPDLIVRLATPNVAQAGVDIGPLVKVYARNDGGALAEGTVSAGVNGYMIDVMLSKDAFVPPGFAVFSPNFVEDALLQGGRISITHDLLPLQLKLYATGAKIPADTPPGNYFLCGRIDPGNKIDESNEGNNFTCNPIRIVH